MDDKTQNAYFHPFQVQRVKFDRASTSRYIQEQLAIAVGLSRYAEQWKSHGQTQHDMFKAG